MKVTMKIMSRVNEVNSLIHKALAQDIPAIEADSTWESQYIFQPIALSATKMYVRYKEVHTGKVHVEKWRALEDAMDQISWVRKCLVKGFNEARRENKRTF